MTVRDAVGSNMMGDSGFGGNLFRLSGNPSAPSSNVRQREVINKEAGTTPASIPPGFNDQERTSRDHVLGVG